ncbi:MAG: hypothetical protein ACYTF1_13270, partial [Planctomycetota bacterium]
PLIETPVDCNDLFAVKIDEKAEQILCRTLPFLAAHPHKRGKSTRVMRGTREIIPINAAAETIYLLGMTNPGGDHGQLHWAHHCELNADRNDQNYIGNHIGDLEIQYADGQSDGIELVMGVTIWFVQAWAYGPTHNVRDGVKEPFVSRPDYAEVLAGSLRLLENNEVVTRDNTHTHYYLGIKPRAKKIKNIIIHDDPAAPGGPLISAITLRGARPADNLKSFGKWRADAEDLKASLRAEDPGDLSQDAEALGMALYTSESDLPQKVKLIDYSADYDAARIRFVGDVKADMLSNMWVANIMEMTDKFERDTGFFHESGKGTPWYGGYSGVGTWTPIGVYHHGAYGRCSDHYATLILRCVNDPVRVTSYVDYCDKMLYFYRSNHDPDKGPSNNALDISKYPTDAPPHWSFGLHSPTGGVPINEISGIEETDGHGATIVGRWVAWRMMGAPKGDWLTAPRPEVYSKSRWDSTRDAAEFVCWLMDYTGMDVMWCEGETTGWANGGYCVPKGMAEETDPVKIKENYANSNMYEPYPTYVCLTALRCSAQMAESVNKPELAKRWRAYADRLQGGMIRQLVVGDRHNLMWRGCPFSTYPSLQDSLVQAWFSIYYDGLDPNRLHRQMTGISRNTLKRQLSQAYGYAPILAMGYGQGWLTKSALILDDMDSAGKLLMNLAKYCYDKNMDHVDTERGIDWRKWLWIIPEGTNIMPDGRWYRIGDLSNGANQGIAIHALELCAGIDDTNPGQLKILPRAPEPLTGLEVTNFFTLIPAGDGLAKARVSYTFERPGQFELKSDRALPTLAVRLGPFDAATARGVMASGKHPAGAKVRLDKSGQAKGKEAWWVWVENLKDISSLELTY